MKKLQRILIPIVLFLTLTSNAYAGIRTCIQKTNPNLDASTIEAYITAIKTYAEMYNLNEAVVAAVIYVESRFYYDSAKKGNFGPMQINWTSHKHRLTEQGVAKSDLLSIDTGVKAGCELLRILLDKYHQNLHVALQRYNTVTPITFANSVISKAKQLDPSIKANTRPYKKSKDIEQPVEQTIVEYPSTGYQTYYYQDGSYYIIQE